MSIILEIRVYFPKGEEVFSDFQLTSLVWRFYFIMFHSLLKIDPFKVHKKKRVPNKVIIIRK